MKIPYILKLLLYLYYCLLLTNQAWAFPDICTIAKSLDFESCLKFDVSTCTCGSFPFTRPCARVSYLVPQSFIEVFHEPKSSFFEHLPGAKPQLSSIKDSIPFGVVDDNGIYSFHGHTLSIPYSYLFDLLPCGGTRMSKMCFDGMSEHLGKNWTTGIGDQKQPAYLAFSSNPKACLLKGAASSAVGDSGSIGQEGGCSFPMDWLTSYPPSAHSVCNGWGIFFPRTGIYHGGSQTAGALMVASRIKNLSSEVFKSMPSFGGEKWQMLKPQSSACFNEGQNIGLLESPIKRVNEVGRLGGDLKGYLFTNWRQVSCCVDYPQLPAVYGALSIIKGVCSGI